MLYITFETKEISVLFSFFQIHEPCQYSYSIKSLSCVGRVCLLLAKSYEYDYYYYNSRYIS